MLLPAIFLAGIGLALTNLWPVETWADLFIAIGAYGTVILFTLFCLYLNREEKDMFLNPLKKLIHRA